MSLLRSSRTDTVFRSYYSKGCLIKERDIIMLRVRPVHARSTPLSGLVVLAMKAVAAAMTWFDMVPAFLPVPVLRFCIVKLRMAGSL